jgi:hypothetical protein
MENSIVQMSAMECNGISQRLCYVLVSNSTINVYRLIWLWDQTCIVLLNTKTSVKHSTPSIVLGIEIRNVDRDLDTMEDTVKTLITYMIKHKTEI